MLSVASAMVNTFDRSTGTEPPDSACFQMSDAEFATALRGWKHPPPLGEEIVRRSGVNAFTKKPFVMARRSPIREKTPPDAGAVRSPKMWHMPWIDVGEVYGFHFDNLAMILLGWSQDYASGEVSSAFVNGPEDVNDWFLLFPRRVVDAIAAIPEDQIPANAARWGTSDAMTPIEDAGALLQRLVPFMRSALATGRRVYFWGSR
jgi:hypothetical protein